MLNKNLLKNDELNTNVNTQFIYKLLLNLKREEDDRPLSFRVCFWFSWMEVIFYLEGVVQKRISSGNPLLVTRRDPLAKIAVFKL